MRISYKLRVPQWALELLPISQMYTQANLRINLFTRQNGLIILLTGYYRFIDDIFLIWKGSKDSLTAFIEYVNGVVPLIKFTHEISCSSVNFLETKVIKNSMGDINTDVYQKPTDTHPYLHWTSAHPPHLKHGIPYSQASRLRRICSSNDILFHDFFVACGYKRNEY